MKFKISQPLAIHQLGSRTNQEDSIFPVLNTATAADRLFILCDGMGGHESGEIASSTVCETISKYILGHLNADEPLDDSLLEEAITEAYAAVNAKDSTGQKKMGTTLTFLCFHKGGCTVAHIGDSRIYHLRPSTNEILYRSRDHSLVYDLFEVGEISFDEIKTAKNKNVITRVIMANQERPSKADIVHITNIQPGDYFYLCSDGMLEQMDDKALMEIFASDKTDEQKRSILIGETVDNSDNHSAYVIHVESVEHEEGDNMFPDNEAAARAANKVLLAELEPPTPPVLPPMPEEQSAAPAAEEEYDDDVQVVVGQPVPPQPNYQAPPVAKKSGSGFKYFLLTFLIVGILVAGAIIFFFMQSNNNNKPVIPAQTTTPSESTIHRPNITKDDDDNNEIRPSNTGSQRIQQNTTPPNRRQNPLGGKKPTGGKTDNNGQGGGQQGGGQQGGGQQGGGQQGGGQQGGGQQGGGQHGGGQHGGGQGGQGSQGGGEFRPNPDGMLDT